MPTVAGIDIGSRTIGYVVIDVESGRIVHQALSDSGFDPIKRARDIASAFPAELLVATGYGRHAAVARFAHRVITEIKAYAVGIRHFLPDVRTVIDIGGQDTKVIALGEKGDIVDFQMNEKCAAGTGKFLEIMAVALGYELDEFGRAPFEARGEDIRISSMCTVFAESEVVSLCHAGIDRAAVAKAVHMAIAERTASMVKRVGSVPPVAFAGGVARNPFMRAALEEKIGVEIRVPEEPQLVGATGAAIEALRAFADEAGENGRFARAVEVAERAGEAYS
jgi:predicted CoA-substrate-specific enzyme activase